MLPRIEAMEQLSTIEAGAMAMGSAEDQARRDRIDKLRSIARGEPQADHEGKRPKKATAEQAAEMGIGMIIVPPEVPPHG
ncbi:MAG: hypothetical protein K2Q27_04990 [Novosphingobium sp.]|nr:hypothetical protein [Novosphingobium sp.]